MQEKSKSNNLFHCLGICHRLFNFIASLTRGLKRVTATCHHMRQGSTAVPIHTTSVGQPNQAQVHHHRAQVQDAREMGPDKMQSAVEAQAKRIREKKGKSVVIVRCEVEEEEEKGEVKLRKDPPLRSPTVMRQRQVRPLFDVAVNINEKSDAFIRSRKEAMRRNYNFDMETCLS